MKKESYFKRVKKPVAKPEDAGPIIKETRTYLLIAAAVAVAGIFLSTFIPSLSTVFTLLYIAAFAVACYFGIMLTVMQNAVRRMKNLTCGKCGEKLGDPALTTYEEISRRWQDSVDSKTARSKLYVTVRFHCQCPKCGTVKSFDETLSSGEIRVTSMSTRDNIMPTQKLVDDYLGGMIRK